jgi:hypothetical protein
MRTDLASVCPMIANVIFSSASGLSPVPLPAEPAVKLRAIHRLLDSVNSSLDFPAPLIQQQQRKLAIAAQPSQRILSHAHHLLSP